MPIGTSDGEHFPDQFSYAQAQANFEQGKSMLRDAYMSQTLDPVGGAFSPESYNDQPTRDQMDRDFRQQGRTTANDLKQRSDRMDLQQSESDTQDEDSPFNAQPQKIQDAIDEGGNKIPDDWNTASENSAGEMRYTNSKGREQVEGNPKYQNLTNPVTQTSKAAVMERINRIYVLAKKMHDGDTVTTDEMVNAFNGSLDHAQGINVIKSLLGMDQNNTSSSPDQSYMMPPGQT